VIIYFFKAERAKIKLDDVEPRATAETVIKTQEGVQDTIILEQITGQANAEQEASDQEVEDYRRRMGDMFCSTVVC